MGNLVFEDCGKIGIGFMRMEPQEYGMEYYVDLLDYAMSKGSNYFESCYFYQQGNCDKLAHDLLKQYHRSRYKLANKMPLHGFLDRGVLPARVFQDQLCQHETDYFDYYLLQAVDAQSMRMIKDSRCIEYLDQKRRNGQVHHLGFSFHDGPEVLEKALSLYDWEFVQIQLNYIDYFNGVAAELVRILEEHNMPFIAMCVTKGSLLERDGDLPISIPISNENRTQAAISFCLSMGASIIMRDLWTKDRMEDNFSIFDSPSRYDKERGAWRYIGGWYSLDDLKETAKAYAKASMIPCTGCGYCDGICPNNVPIRLTFDLYNKVQSGNKDYMDTYANLAKVNPSYRDCTGCMRCVERCPQHMNIPDYFNNQIFQLRY